MDKNSSQTRNFRIVVCFEGIVISSPKAAESLPDQIPWFTFQQKTLAGAAIEANMAKTTDHQTGFHSGTENSSESGEFTVADADRIESQANTNAVSRAMAVMILMLIPGIVGSYLDKRLGTQFLVVIGFALGIGIAIYGLLYVARIADLAAKKSRELRQRIESSAREKSEKDGHG